MTNIIKCKKFKWPAIIENIETKEAENINMQILTKRFLKFI